MDDNFFDDLFDDTPSQLLDFLESFNRIPGFPPETSFTLARHGPFHTSRSELLPTLTPRLSTTGLVATAPVAARQQLPVSLLSTPQRQTSLHSLSFPTTRRDLPLPLAQITNPATASRHPAIQREPNSDDYYLNQLATQNFSSPSLPPRSPRTFGRNQDSASHSNQPSLRNTASASLSGAEFLRRADQLIAGPSFNPSQAELRPNVQASTNMPTGTRRKRRSGGASDADSDLIELSPPAGPSRRSPRRRNTQAAQQEQQQQQPPRPVEIPDSDDLFGSPPPSTSRLQRSGPTLEKDSSDKKRKRDTFDSESDLEDIAVVDLADADTVPESILKQQQKPKNEVKLSTFQCVICMDDCTDLTVTHCGHLFCSECLHSSLHIDVSKKVCPICRQQIEPKPASGKFTQKQKGYYHLELKLMTKKSLGRKPATQQ